MNPQDQAVFDPFIPHKPPEKDVAHLKHLLRLTLPYLEREELSTQTSAYTRFLIEVIREQVN